MSPRPALNDALRGSLLGCAVGDALGLPYEGLSRQAIRERYPDLGRYYLNDGKGMVSDDTEHLRMNYQALVESGGDSARFGETLADLLRDWFNAGPPGAGMATSQACTKLCSGDGYKTSGVFSAGNGPAMRAAVLGLYAREDLALLRRLVEVSTTITHTDPKAVYGALAVGCAATLTWHEKPTITDVTLRMRACIPNRDEALDDLTLLLDAAEASASRGEGTADFAASQGWADGVSGYILQTVPAVLHAWRLHRHDVRAGVMAVLECGGDTDSTAAIAGALLGARVGEGGIPGEWLEGLHEWPGDNDWMRALADQLAEVIESGEPQDAPRLDVGQVEERNRQLAAALSAHRGGG